MNRYDNETNYLPATARRAPVVRIEGSHVQRIAESALQSPTNSEVDAAALRSLETVSEKSTPMDRALATITKSGAIVAVSLMATYALGVAGATGGQAALFFIVLVLGGVGALYKFDAEFSPLAGSATKPSFSPAFAITRLILTNGLPWPS
jgi:hypothetical protein